ncbi:MAG TPA: hypothetical protein VK066_01565 [Chloroflexota bacterium]|nr:hypothetical protein [Chloroflexota bacterium]
MPARTIVLAAFAAVGVVAALAVALLVLPAAPGAAPNLRELSALVSSAQFEVVDAAGLPWYSCH